MASGHLRAARRDDGSLDPGPVSSLGEMRITGKPAFTAEQLGISAYTGETAKAAENLKSLGDRVRLSPGPRPSLRVRRHGFSPPGRKSRWPISPFSSKREMDINWGI